jgi:hypothetical protein
VNTFQNAAMRKMLIAISTNRYVYEISIGLTSSRLKQEWPEEIRATPRY